MVTGSIARVPGAAVRRPRRARPCTTAAAAALAGTLALAACSAGGDDPPSPGDPGGAALPAGEGQTSEAARTGGPPEFHGERPLTVRPGRTVFVQPSCTPDPEGQRPCWGETGNPIQRAGIPTPVTLTDAVMRLDDLGLEWSVRLTFAGGGALAAAASAASRAGDDGRVLLLRDATLLRSLPAAAVTGRVVSLTDLEKEEAWDLVRLVGDL